MSGLADTRPLLMPGLLVPNHNGHLPPSRKRRLGIYYTPDHVARVLARWALGGRPGRVLDPSFGGCSFLRAALSELQGLQAAEPGRSIHGVDIDEGARPYAEELMGLGVPSCNFHFADFFSIEPEDTGQFAAVVGNPPYIRHQWLQRSVRDRAVEACERAGVRLSGLASVWAYFVVHASRFVAEGGRLAFLLPGAVLYADYARAVLQALEARFGYVSAVRMRQRLFADTEEETVLLLAADRQVNARARVRFEETATVEEIVQLMGSATGRAAEPDGFDQTRWKESLLPEETRRILRVLEKEPLVNCLGELARISIGVVTGANHFFVRSVEEAHALAGLNSVQFVAVVARAGWLRAPCWSATDQGEVERQGRPARLMRISASVPPRGRVRNLVNAGEKAGLDQRTKCAIREPWYALTDTAVPDCFLHYMGARAPRLILNLAGATCTNAIHRVTWQQMKLDPRAGVVGSWTSLFALSAELAGRSYGGGVLKVEPTAAACLLVPVVPGAEGWLEDLDRTSRKQGVTDAIALADQRVLKEGIGLNDGEVNAVRTAVALLEARRRGTGEAGWNT